MRRAQRCSHRTAHITCRPPLPPLSLSVFLCSLLISQIRIRVGEYDFSHVQEQLPYIERGVAKKVVHPKYNFFTYEYDLALVKLEQPLEFAPHVSPICLPETESLLIGMNATVTGWGRLSEGGTLPSVLQEVSRFNLTCLTMTHPLPFPRFLTAIRSRCPL